MLSHVQLFTTPWTVACQAPLSSISQSVLKFMSIDLVMLSNPLILCHPLLLLPSIFPSIRVFSSESAFHIRWPKYWSFSFSISHFNEYSGLISFRIDWFDLLAVQLNIPSKIKKIEQQRDPFKKQTASRMESLLFHLTDEATKESRLDHVPKACVWEAAELGSEIMCLLLEFTDDRTDVSLTSQRTSTGPGWVGDKEPLYSLSWQVCTPLPSSRITECTLEHGPLAG